MDLNTLTPKIDTVKTELVHPSTQEPLKHNKKQFWIERHLPHTKEYKKVKYAITQKYINAAQESGKRDIDLYEAEVDTIEVMVQTTVGWQLYYDGEWIEFTPEKAREIYTKAFWIVEQLQEKETSVDLFTQD